MYARETEVHGFRNAKYQMLTLNLQSQSLHFDCCPLTCLE